VKTSRKRNLIYLVVLIAVSAAALVLAARGDMARQAAASPPVYRGAHSGILGMSAHLVQQKVLLGSEGTIGMELVLKTDEVPVDEKRPLQSVDMVVVLDRSGSMSGAKINDARQAVLDLIDRLSPHDRLALISYAEAVRQHFDLLPVDSDNRPLMMSAVHRLAAAGGTNLGAGLDAGIRILNRSAGSGRLGKMILISDGLANRGIVDPERLGEMAAAAVTREFAVSTVGVGQEFNEFLMTTIADRGAGNYYYLDHPAAFAAVFQKEFYLSRHAVATGLTVSVPLAPGIDLVDASGYPLNRTREGVRFHPGSLGSGQSRRLYLTFRVPTGNAGRLELGAPSVSYRYGAREYQVTLSNRFAIACVADEHEVLGSIDRSSWQDKVLREDFNRLRQEVAADIKSGKKDRAIHRIDSYYRRQSRINSSVQSEMVQRNLDQDVKSLREKVDDTFDGAPAAVEQKQKSTAKVLQYQGYNGRRIKSSLPN
jgi:Ca-activated chloride channel family protein